MSNNSGRPLEPLRKAHEDEYFIRQNKELALKLKARSELHKAGIHDDDLAEKLTALGYDSETLKALFLVPVIEVAWADHKLQDEERSEIFYLLEKSGVSKGSKAYLLVEKWLHADPSSDPSFTIGQTLIDPIVTDLKSGGRDLGAWILEAAEKVAKASGGFFGLRAEVSSEEKAVLERLAKKFSAR